MQKTSRFIGARNLLSACVHWRDSDTAACHVADLVFGLLRDGKDGGIEFSTPRGHQKNQMFDALVYDGVGVRGVGYRGGR